MTNLDIIETKISAIQKYLTILSQYQRYSREHIEKDQTLKGAVERYLYLVTQATIDLAEALIALKDFRRPSTYAEAFHILNEEKFLLDDLTEKLAKMAGFRNVIAHDYEEVGFEIIYDVLEHRLVDIKEFLTETKKKLNL